MATAPHQLNNDDLIAKAYPAIENSAMTKYSKAVLAAIVSRFNCLQGDREAIKLWAQEGFNEQYRLRELLAERWKAGYTGIPAITHKYVYQLTDSSFCPNCNSPVHLLHPINSIGSTFYVCFDCKLIVQVGVGPVQLGEPDVS